MNVSLITIDITSTIAYNDSAVTGGVSATGPIEQERTDDGE